LTDACNYTRAKVEEKVLRDRAKLQTPVIVKNWQGADLVLGVMPSQPRAGLLAVPAKTQASGEPR
jgi:hypothetical protein